MSIRDEIKALRRQAEELEALEATARNHGLSKPTIDHYLTIKAATQKGVFTFEWVSKTTGLSAPGTSSLTAKLENAGLIKETRIDGMSGKYKAFTLA